MLSWKESFSPFSTFGPFSTFRENAAGDVVRKTEDLIHHDTFQVLALALAEVVVAWVISDLVKRFCDRAAGKSLNRGIVTFLGSFLSITIRILGVIVALDQLGVSMNVIIGTMSGLGVGVALALKNNMASVASGLQILLTRPFKVGDFISIDSSYGTVLAIELTYTTLLTSDNEEVVVPNNTFLTDNMVNYTARDTLRCVLDFPCSSADILRYLPQLTACAVGCSLVLQDPPPVARVNQFQSGGQADLKLIYYCRTDQYWLTRDQVAKAVAGLFEEGTGQTEPANTGITASSCASAAGSPAAENQG
ncbi:mechanosensitive ion channel family protein [Faecalibaculum rodentium]|uniref:mechanosensitive ion channel family protein n=1 Tax=Faecalibaculum rodentium TaxID=1702221 RepID=UPI00263AC34C|nr:mechanosensitive ion channel domain-containing protein [Faecalibaculum rodentium]